nr:FixH family protein [uncultured Pseudacidovorax sp.]
MMNPTTLASAPRVEPSSGPWWRHPLMWMVVGGPAAVVVAGLATLWLAVHSPDPVIEADYYRRGIEINRTLEAQRALTPAQQARNHVTTPTRNLPPAQP